MSKSEIKKVAKKQAKITSNKAVTKAVKAATREAKKTAKKTAKKAATKAALKQVKESKLSNEIKVAKMKQEKQETTEPTVKVKTIGKRVIKQELPVLGEMPITVYFTTYNELLFEHTDKKAVKAWRKEQKQVNRKPVDPDKLAARLQRHITKAVSILGDELTQSVVSEAMTPVVVED